MRHGSTVFVAIFVTHFSIGCPHGTPPTPQGIDAAVAPLPGPGTGASTTSDHADASSTATQPPRTLASAIASSSAASAAAATSDAGDPGSLPQTRDKPPAASTELEARARALWDGIAHDDPDRAVPFFFPVTAYEQVKAIPSPSSDWRRRLVAAYKRDIHGLAKRLGEKGDSAKFVRLDVPDDRARWVEPNEESNKLGYWRVYGTRIVYEMDGKEKSFDISSLISWRGDWYVVHLTGFK
jgi:hypothetical protein